MSRFSDWYLNARARLARQEAEHVAGNAMRADEKILKERRKQGYKKVDKQMKELRKPDDTPPWEKK